MDNLPVFIGFLFIATTLQTVFVFYKAAHHSNTALFVILVWLLLQGLVAQTGFYTVTDTLPPRFVLLVLPPVLLVIGLFLTKRGRYFLDNLDLKRLTLLHSIRVPVEIVLFLLATQKVVPELMTFEGRNFDILSGLTAPLVYFLYFVRQQIGRTSLLVWNIVCLLLLVNIVVNAALSAPFPSTQQFAFEQPNIAVLYFPFVWLPSCVVPLVLVCHLAAIRRLVRR